MIRGGCFYSVQSQESTDRVRAKFRARASRWLVIGLASAGAGFRGLQFCGP
jgi:hypothetical protein